MRAEIATNDVLKVGELGAPAPGSSDPQLLLAAESLGRVLISLDRRSLPNHLADHFRAGNRTSGVILLRNGFALHQYVEEIVRQTEMFEPDEWIDRTIYIP
jgi:hypothetical protein